MGIKKGTKLTATPKDKIFKFRIDDPTARKLETVCSIRGKTKSEVIRTGIEIQYKEVMKDNEDS